jgi:hypothetical protein
MPDNPTNADIIARVDQLHECVEAVGKIAETNHASLGDRVDDLADTIGAVGTVADAAKTAAEAATAAALAASQASKDTHDMVNTKFDDLNKAGWKFVGSIALAMFVGVVTICVAIFLNGLSLKGDQTARQEATSAAAVPARAADDARDADRDARILAAIAAMKSGK